MLLLQKTLPCFLFVFSISPTHADDEYWVSPSGDFDDPSNWFSGPQGGFAGAGNVPGTTDRAVFWSIFVASDDPVVTDDQNRSIRGIMVATNDVTLDLSGFTMKLLNSTDYVDDADGTLILGETATHDGSLTLLDGTLESLGEIVVAGASGTNQVLRIGNDALLDADVTHNGIDFSRDIHLGVNGVGQLLAEDGGKIIADNLRVGIKTGSIGTFSLNATGSNGTRADLVGDAIFGERGTGFGVISNGATFLTGGRSSIGADFASPNSSLVTLQSGGLWAGNAFEVGGRSSGRLSLSGGSTVNGSLFTVAGRQMGDIVGHIDLQTGSKLNASNMMLIGSRGGIGKLDVLSGSEVNASRDLQVGVGQGSDGRVLLSGSGSEITVSDDLSIGTLGTGKMTIAAGADLSTDRSYIGWRYNELSEQPSDGTATLQGSGSTWTNDGLFYVGHAGEGSLEISSGGVLKNTGSDFYLGREATGKGTVTVVKNGAMIDASGQSVIVGRLGEGSLILQGDPDFGTVNSPSPPSLVTEDLTVGFSGGSTGKFEIRSGNGVARTATPNLAIDDRLTLGRSGSADVLLERTYLPVNDVMIAEFGASIAEVSLEDTLLEVDEELVLARSGVASLTLDSGADIFLKRPDLFSMAVNPGSSATLSLQDGSISFYRESDFSIPHQPIIGDNGSAFVFLSNESTIYTDGPVFARGVGSTATVLIQRDPETGSPARWYTNEFSEVGGVYSASIVGDSGTAVIDLAGGFLTGQRMFGRRQFVLGNNPGGSGTIRITDDGTLSSSGTVVVGDGGFGRLEVSTLGNASLSALEIGVGSKGEVSIVGVAESNDRELEVYTYIEAGVGADGDAEMIIANGQAGAGELRLGRRNGTADFKVTGPGGLFESKIYNLGENGEATTTGDVIIGHSGTGTLHVEDGSTFYVERDLSVGLSDGSFFDRSVGSITVTGAGSELEVAGLAKIGVKGDGVLAIEAGGAGEFETLLIADHSIGTGKVHVDGDGSALDVDEEIRVGVIGKGELFADNGGYIGAEKIRFRSSSKARFSGVGTMVETINDFDLTGGGFNRATVSNGATLSVGQTLRTNTFGRIELLTGGKLKPSAVIGDLENSSGTFSPGPRTKPLGLVPITGKYTQESGGLLLMEIGGPLYTKNYDTVSTTEKFTANGSLRVVLVNGYAPKIGDSFKLVETPEFTGEFFNLNLPALPGILGWETEQTLTEFTLNVVELTPLQVWRREYGLASDGSEDLDDASENGVANLLYFAFGLGDPAATEVRCSNPASGTPGMPIVKESSTSGQYTFIYTRHKNINSGVEYHEDSTTDLSDWDDLRTLANSEKIISEKNISLAGTDYEIVILTLLSAQDLRLHRIGVVEQSE